MWFTPMFVCVCVFVCQASLAESLSCQDPPTAGDRYYLHISCQKEYLHPVGPSV